MAVHQNYRTDSEGACNRCHLDVGQRVEMWEAAICRSLVCGVCALAIAKERADEGIAVRVKPFTMPRVSTFVAGDQSYWPNPRHAELRQRELEAKAERFAKRIAATIERELAREAAARSMHRTAA